MTLQDDKIKSIIPSSYRKLAKFELKKQGENLNQINFDEKFRSQECNFRIKGENEFNTMRLSKLLTKLRNGIAHQNIIPKNEGGKWEGVIIWNNNNGVMDFAMEFSAQELKDFSIEIATRYKQVLNPEQKNSGI